MEDSTPLADPCGSVEVSIGGNKYEARLTFDAIRRMERELGPLGQFALQLHQVDLTVIATVLHECLLAGSGSEGRDVPSVESLGDSILEAGIREYVLPCDQLLSYALGARPGKPPEKSNGAGEAAGDRSVNFPFGPYYGCAVALWHVQPESFWKMTVPEWWMAYDTYKEANDPKAGRRITDADAEQFREWQRTGKAPWQAAN